MQDEMTPFNALICLRKVFDSMSYELSMFIEHMDNEGELPSFLAEFRILNSPGINLLDSVRYDIARLSSILT